MGDDDALRICRRAGGEDDFGGIVGGDLGRRRDARPSLDPIRSQVHEAPDRPRALDGPMIHRLADEENPRVDDVGDA